MKIITLFTLLLTTLGSLTAANHSNIINPVIGDESFIATYGFAPDHHTVNDQIRITTHLKYVEEILRKKDVSHMSKKLQEKRAQLLNLLHRYWEAGVFPKNEKYTVAKPCFIDNRGNICAVGYLVEQTIGRAVAETINSVFQYSSIYEMKSSGILDEWLQASGITLKEAAMIQPAYSPYQEPKAYHIFTYASSALSVAALTASKLGENSDHWLVKSAPYIGLASGLSQTYFGYTNMRSSRWQPVWSYSYLHYDGFNVGLGLATTLVSSYQLITRRKKPTHATSFFSPSTFTLPDRQLAMGFQFVKRF